MSCLAGAAEKTGSQANHMPESGQDLTTVKQPLTGKA